MNERVCAFLLGVAVGISLFGIVIALGGCTTDGTKRFNNEDQQDGMCYGEYGGEFGYCTRSPK